MTTETMRLILVAVLLLAILAVAYRPKWLPLVAVGGFLAFYGPLAANRLQSWNVFHYWLNTKYLSEIGFTDFYSCAYEASPEKFGSIARNLQTYEYQQVSTLPPCPRENFTAARWQEFSQDLAWLKAQPARPLVWSGVMRDKGLNTTPTWLAIAEPLANMFPAGGAGWWTLLYSDFILLAAALVFVGFTRGPQVASLMAVFLLTWVGTVPQLMGHWFQYLWLVLCLVGAGAWHKKWYGISGAALALAAALRIFPAALFIWPLLHWRRVPKRFWRAAIATGGAAVMVGSFTSLGLSVWPEFAAKIMQHSNQIVMEPGNFGLRNLIFMASNPAGAMATWAAFALGDAAPAVTSPGWSWLMVAVMAALAAIATGKQKDMSFGSGLPFLFSGLVLSRYYYGVLALSFDDSSQDETIALLLISLVFFVCLYWLHPVVSYSVGQGLLLIYVYWKVNKWI